ncbi:MAG: hypothetical protein AAGI23_13220 [Bacteroidota bacterium]
MKQNVTVIIRASGERTEQLCRLLVEQQVPKEQIFLIHVKPFSRAVEETFRIGREGDKRWTLAVDADVLLARRAVEQLIAGAEALPASIQDKLYVYQGHISCHVFGKPRTAGLHLYQTKFLEQATTFIPTDPHARWPESTTYRSMNDLGYYHYVQPTIYALHDYEQYYKDIFRNGYFQAKKHFHYLDNLLPYWKEKAATELEFDIMLRGWMLGVLDGEQLRVDKDFFDHILTDEFTKLNVIEKAAINLSKLSFYQQLIHQEIDRFCNFPLSSKLFPNQKKPPTFNRKVKTKLGHALIKLGNAIKK